MGTKPAKNVLKALFDWVESFAFALAVVVLLFTFVMRTVTIEGESMMPTVTPFSKVITYQLFYAPQRYDVIVLSLPSQGYKPYIKRIIGMPGDVVDIDSRGVVTVGGEPIDARYTFEDIYLRGDQSYPVTVPEDSYFVMGDNRNNSKDSRFISVGCVGREYIIGRALFLVYPFSQAKVLS